MWTQLTFVGVHFVFVTVTAGLLFLALKHTIGLRVSPEEEMAGLDVEEHGSPGYGHEHPSAVGIGVPGSGGGLSTAAATSTEGGAE